MIIVISGSVGSGKTTIAQDLAKKLKYDVIHLGELAEKYKIKEIKKLQTFDFDIDKLLDDIEAKVKSWRKQKKNIIIESHFAHFIKPELVDFLFVINRDLKDLKKEYKIRKYNAQKIKDNLEVESFNLCFYEALENGYEEDIGKIYCIDNDSDLKIIVNNISKKIVNNHT